MRKSKIDLLFCISFIFFIFIIISHASSEQKKDLKEPVIITSHTLTADNKAKTAVFEGAVKATKGDITLYADKMIVYYHDEKSGSSIKKIDAEGNIKLVKGDRVVLSKFAQYFPDNEERVIFTGEPQATDGENIITGAKMTYFFKTDRYVVEKSKVFMQDNSAMKGQKKKD